MQTSRLMMSMLSAWGMAIAYDQIEVATGTEVHVLLCAAIVTVVAGLYFGLRTKNNETKREET